MKRKTPLSTLAVCLLAALPFAAPLAAPVRAQDAPANPAEEGGVEVPLNLSTMGERIAVQGAFFGKVNVTPERLSFQFDRARLMTVKVPHLDLTCQVVGVRALLCASSKRPYTFDIVAKGTPTAVGRELTPEEPLDIEAFGSALEVPPGTDLARCFVSIEVEMSKKQPDGKIQPSFVYIRTAEGVLAPKE